jgi:hypothetical protein
MHTGRISLMHGVSSFMVFFSHTLPIHIVECDLALALVPGTIQHAQMGDLRVTPK